MDKVNENEREKYQICYAMLSKSNLQALCYLLISAWFIILNLCGFHVLLINICGFIEWNLLYIKCLKFFKIRLQPLTIHLNLRGFHVLLINICGFIEWNLLYIKCLKVFIIRLQPLTIHLWTLYMSLSS